MVGVMTDLDDIKRRLDVLESLTLKRSAEVNAIEAKIIEHARQYARLTKLGYVVSQSGRRDRYPPEDCVILAQYQEQEMRRLAFELLAAETG
jgi:hypothetical protein